MDQLRNGFQFSNQYYLKEKRRAEKLELNFYVELKMVKIMMEKTIMKVMKERETKYQKKIKNRQISIFVLI